MEGYSAVTPHRFVLNNKHTCYIRFLVGWVASHILGLCSDWASVILIVIDHYSSCKVHLLNEHGMKQDLFFSRFLFFQIQIESSPVKWMEVPLWAAQLVLVESCCLLSRASSRRSFALTLLYWQYSSAIGPRSSFWQALLMQRGEKMQTLGETFFFLTSLL